MLFPAILAFSSIGVYSVNSNAFDLYAVAFFGILGYVLVKLECEPAPLLLGFVLGPLLEENLRRAMIISRGDPLTFLERPISAALLALAVIALVIVLLPNVARKREEVFVEED
jgi:TctA family transporter